MGGARLGRPAWWIFRRARRWAIVVFDIKNARVTSALDSPSSVGKQPVNINFNSFDNCYKLSILNMLAQNNRKSGSSTRDRYRIKHGNHPHLPSLTLNSQKQREGANSRSGQTLRHLL
jgi:hypothetical protein